jgi:APA family basic amino acid/polyamine antiporter
MATLKRTLGLRDMFFLVIGSVIGSGIFLVPGGILRRVDGSVGAAMAVWVAGGVLSLLGALTYGELTAMRPEAGGLYVFIREGFGRLPAFLYGWTLFLMIASGAVATLAVAFSNYLGELVPLSPLAGKVISVSMIALLTAVNVRGTRQSADLQNWTTLLKAVALIAMGVLLLVLGRMHIASAVGPAAQSHASIFSRFGLAMIDVLWAYEGWQFVTYSAGEVKDPQRNFPRAFLSGMLFLIGAYVLANLGYLAVLGPQGVAESNRVAATAVAAALGPWASKLVAMAILVAVFSAANSIQLTAPRVFYAMASDGLFFRRMAEVHPRFHTPAFAVIGGGVWAAVMACTGTFQQLLTYVVFTGWIFYGLSAASIFVYRRRMPDAERLYRVPGYPWPPLFFVLAACALVANTISAAPRAAALGLAIVLSGVPVYFLWQRRGAPPL